MEKQRMIGSRSSVCLKSVLVKSFPNGMIWFLLLGIGLNCNALKIRGGYSQYIAASYGQDVNSNIDSDMNVTSLPKIRLLNLTSAYGGVSYRVSSSPLSQILYENDTVYIVPSSRTFLSFECSAKYPVFWNLGHANLHPTMYHAVRVMSIRKFKDPYDPTTFVYVSILSLNGPAPKLSGNYSCQHTARHFIQSSILIYWESSSGSQFVHSKENLTVSVSSSLHETTTTIRLPCQLTDPDARPKLKKEIDASKNSYEDLHLNDSIEYLNGAGYILKNLPNPLGTYKCLLDETEFVSIRVVQENGNRSSYTFEYDDTHKQVKCCSSGKGKRAPKIYMMDCQHPSTCAIRENLPSESVSFIWNQGKRRGNCAVFNLQYIHTGVLRCIGNGFSTFKEFIAPLEAHRRIWNEKRNSTTYFRWEEIDPQDMIVVSSSLDGPIYPYYYPRRPNDDKKPKIIYSKQNVQLTCHTSRYYFASGTYWMIRWKNHTITRLSDDDIRNNPRRVDDLRFYVDRERHLNTISLVAQPQMESAICFAPVWNSSVWIPKIRYLYVNDSMAPEMKDSLEIVNLTWYANETDKIISCSAAGLPAPTFLWEKDNITILPSTHNYNVFVPNVSESNEVTTTTTPPPTTTVITTNKTSSGNDAANIPDDASDNDGDGNDAKQRKKLVGATSHSSLQISRVSFNTRGVFRCTATNVGGRATKEFHITVLEVKSWKVTGILVGASVISVLLIGGIIYLLRKLYGDRQEINQLANTSSTSPTSNPSVNFNEGMSRNSSNGGSHEFRNNNSSSTNTGILSRFFSRKNGVGNSGSNTRNNNNSGRLSDSANRSLSFDNGSMTNNLIDTF